MNCSLPGSSVHGILQTRILEWVVMPSSRGSSQSRDQTCVSWNAGRFFTAEAPGKPPIYAICPKKPVVLETLWIKMMCDVSGRPNSRFPVRLWRKGMPFVTKQQKKKQQNKTILFGRKTPGMIWVSDRGFCILHLELGIIRSIEHKVTRTNKQAIVQWRWYSENWTW